MPIRHAADGSTEILTSDDSWKYSYGARLEADIYNGEKYDARRGLGAWTCADFDDSAWGKPAAEPLLQRVARQIALVGASLAELEINHQLLTRKTWNSKETE